jgi:hypothetical protein
MKSIHLLAAALLWATPALADEFDIVLKPGPGVETVSVQCAACHSIDYIKMNSPFMSPATWKAEVTKMRKAFGAPIDDATAEEILGYVIAAYGVPTHLAHRPG